MVGLGHCAICQDRSPALLTALRGAPNLLPEMLFA